MEKLLFLDIDGVLNSASNLFLPFSRMPRHFLDERAVHWLALAIVATNCKVVISSTWRKDIEFQEFSVLKAILYNAGLPESCIIGKTPIESGHRGVEVALYLEQYAIAHPGKHISFVVLDDGTDVLYQGLLDQTPLLQDRLHVKYGESIVGNPFWNYQPFLHVNLVEGFTFSNACYLINAWGTPDTDSDVAKVAADYAEYLSETRFYNVDKLIRQN